jgi:hypothetical protein
MVMDKVSINDLLMDIIPGQPPPDVTPHKDPLDPQQPYLTSTTDQTKTKAHRQVVGMGNAGGETYGKATALYNNH